MTWDALGAIGEILLKPMAGIATAATVSVLFAAPPLWAQTSLKDEALAVAATEALEPGVRAALKDGQPVSFEHRSAWGETVKSRLEESLGLKLTPEHRRGASRILLGAPRFDADTALVEVWFGRCETAGDAEILKIRIYSFTFKRDDQEWSLLRAARLGTSEGSCEGDLNEPQPVQT
jgi:hypothetical protein